MSGGANVESGFKHGMGTTRRFVQTDRQTDRQTDGEETCAPRRPARLCVRAEAVSMRSTRGTRCRLVHVWLMCPRTWELLSRV
eukprot:scaffold79474_cov54-Phaeocystis_antarctica.AAC.1